MKRYKMHLDTNTQKNELWESISGEWVRYREADDVIEDLNISLLQEQARFKIIKRDFEKILAINWDLDEQLKEARNEIKELRNDIKNLERPAVEEEFCPGGL